MNNELKYLIKPGGLLLALVVMLILVINLGSKQILGLNGKVEELKESERVLGLKLDILETVDEVLADDITHVDIALPSKGSVLYGISQIRKLSSTKNVVVTSLKTSPDLLGDDGISRNSINFEAEGSEADIYAFLESFYTALPLMNLDKVRVGTTEGVTRAVVTVNIYAANLPEKIPALTEEVVGFSNSDIETLGELSQYTLPDFFEPKPVEGADRGDPFN